MKKKHLKMQLTLVSIGLLLFILTYVFYPNIKKNKVSKDLSIGKNFEKTVDTEKMTTFDSLEYKGLYDFNKPFKVKSKKAYILNKEPDIVHMDNMHVIMYLTDGRIVNITSDKGKYNKTTHDCFFEQNVKATDGSTKIFAENLDLLATKNFLEIYNNVSLDNTTSYVEADKINYNFETKHFKVLMFDDKSIKMKIFR
jgi:LPS export ABC transporter protein LptC